MAINRKKLGLWPDAAKPEWMKLADAGHTAQAISAYQRRDRLFGRPSSGTATEASQAVRDYIRSKRK